MTTNIPEQIKIDKKLIHLIAEIGINHNGDLNITKKLIDNAKLAGFHSVKFQKRTIEKVYSKDLLDSPRESPWGKTQRDQKNGLEFGKKEYDEIDKYCREVGIDWFASPWDLDSLSFLDNYSLKYQKVASAMVVDLELLKKMAQKKIYTFISTGMCTVEQIDNAVNIFKNEKCEFELMHCVSTYPAKIEDLNLRTIDALKKRYNIKVGYSGHENGVVISAAAFLYGLSSLERHITLDRTMYGSDQAASIELSGMIDLTQSLNKIITASGKEKLGFITEEEMKVANKLRAHIKQ